MPATLLAPRRAATLRLRPLWPTSPPLVGSAVVLAALAVVCLGGLAVDPRTLAGEPLWIKPLKFCISGALYALGLAIVLRPLLDRRMHRIAGWGVAVILVVETVLIAIQAARGVRSHFNVGSAFDASLFASMGLMIGTLWILTFAAAIALLRAPNASRLWKQASLWGLAIALAGGATGVLMTQPSPEQIEALVAGTGTVAGAHTVGAPDGGPGLPLVGWSTVGGDLRVPHFWGLHGLQALPLLALGLVRLRRLTDRQRRRLLALGALGYIAVFGTLLQQALRAQPLVAPDATTFGLFTAVVLGLVLAAGLALRVRPDAATA